MRPILIVLLLVVGANLFAQERPAFGVYGDFSDNIHSADFQHLPGVPSCCPRYETGTGPGIAAGVLYSLPVATDLMMQFRLGFQSIGATLSETEFTTVYHNSAPVQGAFTHTLDASISTLGLEPIVGWKVLGKLQLHLGMHAALLLAKSYTQQEQITQPDGSGTFLDSLGNDSHSRIRNQSSGTIPNASAFQAALITGISYSLPLNEQRTMELHPELMYSYGVTNIATSLQWKANSVRAGVVLLFSPLHTPEHVPVPPKEEREK
ncbi:MAG: hypothetical protein JSS75_14665 [Bacteroidetes bacterium]|nr:hypothetical protein [Bacteroidota bacterium]